MIIDIREFCDILLILKEAERNEISIENLPRENYAFFGVVYKSKIKKVDEILKMKMPDGVDYDKLFKWARTKIIKGYNKVSLRKEIIEALY